MKRFAVKGLLMSLVAMCFACQPQPQPQPEPEPEVIEFSVTDAEGQVPTKVEVAVEGIKDYKLTVDAGAEWSASVEEGEEWIELTPSSGEKGVAEVTVEVAANTLEQKRSATVTFVCDEHSVAVEFEQAEFVKNEEPPKPPVDELPTADLLDIVFNGDGSAYDNSPMNMNVQYLKGAGLVCYYNETYQRYAAHFSHKLAASVTEGYYKIDYTQNSKFKSAIADGHSIEILIRMDQEPNGEEIKPFSSMQAGGTGFLITAASRGMDMTFLPNVSTNGSSTWRWTQSKIKPQVGRYYHLVGVWDKEAGKSYIYVDGVLKSQAAASGNLVFPTSGNTWFCVGGDPYGSVASSMFNGDVVMARIYDDAISSEQVGKLYEQVEGEVKQDVVIVSDLTYMADAYVHEGCWYYIYGKGFAEGDSLTLESLSDTSVKFDCQTVFGNDHVKLQVPAGVTAGSYRIVLYRGAAMLPLGYANLKIAASLEQVSHNTKVVAHRGYHPGTVPENSVAALVEAQKLGVYGSEFDVYVTLDDVVVLYHNETLSGTEVSSNASMAGKRLDSSYYDDIKDYKLANGEKLPTLEDYLDQAELYPDVKLILEIKTHNTTEKNMRAVQKCYEAVAARSMQNQVEYIAFDYNICKKIVEIDSNAIVQYLGGNRTPSSVWADGIKGIDYSSSVLTDAWIKQAHELGMIVNVWTVNDQNMMLNFINKGVDLLTTDESEVALQILSRPFVSDK